MKSTYEKPSERKKRIQTECTELGTMDGKSLNKKPFQNVQNSANLSLIEVL